MSSTQKPKISLFATAIRTNLWKGLYKKTISENNIPLEFVFVGSNRPNFKLPKNFKFIYSNVKPVQCLQIALMECSADLVFSIADDCCFSKNLFDILYDKHISSQDEKIIYGPSFIRDGLKYQEKDYTIKPDHVKDLSNDAPKFPISALLKKSDVINLEGFDRNFIAVCAVQDLFLRLIESGKVFHRIEDVFIEEFTINTFKKDRLSIFFHTNSRFLKLKSKFFHSSNIPKAGQNMFAKFGYKCDWPMLESLWIAPFTDNISKKDVYCIYDDLYVSKKRLKSFEPFNTHEILKKSQGPTAGQWS